MVRADSLSNPLPPMVKRINLVHAAAPPSSASPSALVPLTSAHAVRGGSGGKIYLPAIEFWLEREKYGDSRRLGVRVKIQTIIAEKKAHTISAGETIPHLVERLNSFRVGALVVSSDGKRIDGIVSERDVVRAMPGKFDLLSDLHVRDIMTVGVYTCTADATVAEIMAMMTKERIRHVPVVDSEGNLISVISIGDVVKHYLSELSVENQALKDYVSSAH